MLQFMLIFMVDMYIRIVAMALIALKRGLCIYIYEQLFLGSWVTLHLCNASLK